MSTVFGPNYAAIYDALYADKPYAKEVDAALTAARSETTGRPLERVLDLGCGTGRHAAELVGHGLEVTGVDRAEDMLAVAMRRCPTGRFVRQDIAELALERRDFDAAFMFFAVFGYLGAQDRARQSLRHIAEHLRPGGVLVADFWWGPSVLAEPPEPRRARVGDLVRRAHPVHDPATQTVTVQYAVEDSQGAVLFEEAHRVRYFDHEEVELLCHSAGLSLERIVGWPDMDASPGSGAWPASMVVRRW